MLAAFLLQAASPATVKLQVSLEQWRDCVRSSARTSDQQTVGTMFADAFDQCQMEQEAYRSAVTGFASPKDGLSPSELGQAADQLVADKKAIFRSDFGQEVAGEVAVRQAIRATVAEHNASLRRK